MEIVGKLGKDNRVFQLLENGEIDYVILTGSTEPEYIRDFIHLNHRCVQLGIPCLTSLDTAGALTDILASRYNQGNTELIDICNLRTERQKLPFAKMQTCGNDYIFLEDFDGEITCPESLCVTLCDRHYGIGADGIILMEKSRKADARMRMFNADGSEGSMAGNALRCMAKYLYDNGIVRSEEMTIETDKGTKTVRVYTTDGKVTSASVDMGLRHAGHGGPAPEHPGPPGGGLAGRDRGSVLAHHLRGHGQPPLRGCSAPGWTAWTWPGSGLSSSTPATSRTGSTRNSSGW